MLYSYITKTIITTLIIASSVISSVNVNAQDYSFIEKNCNQTERFFKLAFFGACKIITPIDTVQSNPLSGSCSEYMFNRTGLGLVNTIYLTQSNTKVKITSCKSFKKSDFGYLLDPIDVNISRCRNQKLYENHFDNCESGITSPYYYKNLVRAEIQEKPVEKTKTRLENKNSLNKASNCVYYILKNKSTTKTCYPVLAKTSKMMLLKTNGDLSKGDERYIPIYKGESQDDRIWVANNRTSTIQK